MRHIAIVTDASIAMRGAVEILVQEFGVERIEVTLESRGVVDRDPHPDLIIINPFGSSHHASPQPDLVLLSRFSPILAFSPARPMNEIWGLVQDGVRGYVDWAQPTQDLIRASYTLAAGGTHIHSAMLAHYHGLATKGEARIALTGREAQVLLAVASGMTHKEIARALTLSKLTVDTYVQRIRRKLGVRNKAELTTAAHWFGLLNKSKKQVSG